jgi:hypothetical protein
MLDFGYDEGGGDGTLLVSVQLGSSNSLKSLDRHWRAALGQYGVSFFHSKDYKNRSSGVFKGLSRARRRRLLAEMAALIQKYLSAGVTARINERYYEAHTAQQFRSEWGSAYSYALHMATLAGYVYMKRVGREKEAINILVAHGHRNLGQVLEQLPKLVGNPTIKLHNSGYGFMRDSPILQAADMLAYGEWQKHKNGDLEIYDALHRQGAERNQPYVTETFECSEELIQVATRGVAALMEERKAFGMRRQKAEASQSRESDGEEQGRTIVTDCPAYSVDGCQRD